MFFSKNTSILGVDIGTSDIKIAQIAQASQGAVLETYGIVNLAYQMTDSTSPDVIEKSAKIIKDLIKHAGVTTKRCVISLPNNSVFTSIIQMPEMSEKELDKSIRFEAKKYIPLSLDEVILSWQPVSSNSETKLTNILLTAVPIRLRESYKQIFEIVGLNLEVIEIEALALIRSLITDSEKNYVIIDIGSKVTGINFVKNGFLQLSRSLNIGGETITSRISSVLNISVARAEQFKKDFGVSGEGFIPESIAPILDTIRKETEQLLTIYRAKSVNVDKIIITGGSSLMPGLVDYLSALGVEVELGNPLLKVTYPKEVEAVLNRYASHLAIAIGLALNPER